MNQQLDNQLRKELNDLKESGTYKNFNVLESPMDAKVRMKGRGEIIVLSSNNYLGLSSHPEVKRAGMEGIEKYGAGTASVRFICGTFAPHIELEKKLADFLHTEAATTYVSCWNANEAVIPSLTDPDTVILSDELNHASVIDGIRLSKPAKKVIFKHSDMDELKKGLESCGPDQRKLVVTDGVFSMEGDLARLPDIVELSKQYNAIVVVDDSHGTGVMGKTGRGVAEHFGLLGEIDVISSTLGKALGGAAGGFVASTQAVCDMLTQRSRPQLFSNALPPTVACSALKAVEVLERDPSIVDKLRDNVGYFRRKICEAGFKPLEGETAIIPIIVGETAFAIELSKQLLDEGVFVTGFGYPVVPEGRARIRVQMSAALKKDDLDRAVEALCKVGKNVGLL